MALGDAWYDESGIANIYSFAKLRAKYEVGYDAHGNKFQVKTPNQDLTFG